MSDLKKNRFFRKWKAVASRSTLKAPTSQKDPGLTPPKWENPANGIVVSIAPVRQDSPDNVEVLPKPGQSDLWGLAYKQLSAKNESLVRRYEEVLERAGIVSVDSVANIQEQAQAVLVTKRKQILQRQWSLQWGNKSIKVRAQIDRIIKIIGAFKEAGSVAANVDPLHAGLPWAGICFLLAPVLNDSQQGEALLSGLEMITDLVARHSIVDEHLAREPGPHGSGLGPEVEHRKILIKLYTKVLEFQAKAACYLSHGTLTRLARNIPKVDDWRALQSSIVRIEAECREYASLNFALKQQSSLRALIESIDEQKERLTDLITTQKLQQNAALMVTQLISDIPVGQDHEDIRTRLGPQYWNSGQWIFKSRQYLDWTSCKSSSILWLQGPVGVGKSCMTSIVIQKFLADAIDNKVAFFYCSQQHNSSADVLRSLLAQMSYGSDGDLVQPVRDWFELQTGLPFRTSKELQASIPPHLARKISSKECVELLSEILPFTMQTTLIIDALDECQDHDELLDYLKQMQEQYSKLKIFISSRMGIYRKHEFIYSYVIEHFDSKSDLSHFIDCEIHSAARRDRSGMTPSQANTLRTLLMSRADGMFRWVELQLDVFLSRNNPILHPADVQTKLKQLRVQSINACLTSVYTELFRLNIRNQQKRLALAIKTLQWVFCAFKPLTIEDLARAVALDSDGNTDTVVTGSFLLQICGSFIIVTSSGSVRFAHRSVKEYLANFELPECEGREFSFSHTEAHAQVAETCLSFLLSFGDASKWGRLPTNIHEKAVDLSLTGFEMYACFFWASHCENANRDERRWKRFKRLKRLLDTFVSVTPETVREDEVSIVGTAFQRWISLLWRVFQTDINIENSMRQRLEDAISDPPTPLFTACIWGFADKVLILSEQEGQVINLKNLRAKCCLHLACENGHGEIIDILLDSAAFMNEGPVRWGTYLNLAASSGQLTSFVKMLPYGAQDNTPEDFKGQTIDAAIMGGNPAIVIRALKAGAEVRLPSTDAPIRSRKRCSRVLPSAEIPLSKALSKEDSVLGDSRQDLVTLIGVPGLGYKDCTPPGHYNLLARLSKASFRRRELLDYWRLAYEVPTAVHRCSDELAIAAEASGSLTESIQDSRVLDPLPPQKYSDGVSTHDYCYYCLRKLGSRARAPLWRYHVMAHLLPYLCPFTDCKLHDKMWGLRVEWETHLNDQHPIPHAQVGGTGRYSFTCNICRRTFHSDDHSLREGANSPFCVFRNSHYADHMERIALSVEKDYGFGVLAIPRMCHTKRLSRLPLGRENLADFAISNDSSTFEHDEEGISERRGRLGHRAGLASPHGSLSSKPTRVINRVCIKERWKREYRAGVASAHDSSSSGSIEETISRRRGRRRHRSRAAKPNDSSSSERDDKAISGRRWRPKHRSDVANSPDSASSEKEAMSGWSSECSNHSRAEIRPPCRASSQERAIIGVGAIFYEDHHEEERRQDLQKEC